MLSKLKVEQPETALMMVKEHQPKRVLLTRVKEGQ